MIKAVFLDFAGVVSEKGSIVKDYFVPYWGVPYDEIRPIYDKGRKGEIGFEEITKGIDKEKLFSYLKSAKLTPHAKEALETLSKKYKLYLASNHLPVLFEKEVEFLGVKQYFTNYYPSYKLKSVKPEKEFYKKILAQSGMKAAESIFVDDAKLNLKTAKELGFLTVWFNKENTDKRNEIDYEPDYEIKDLGALANILEELNEQK